MRSILQRARLLTDTVMVGFSGKDSLVTLDLCVKTFKRVEAFNMYMIPGLGFQERYLNAIAKLYKIPMHHRPHWALGQMLGESPYRPENKLTGNAAFTRLADSEAELRQSVGIDWFAYGHTVNESLERRGMIHACKGIDVKARRFYPIASYNLKQIWGYIRHHKLIVSPEYTYWKRSWGEFDVNDLRVIKKRYPKDYDKIKEWFPEIETVLKRDDFFGPEISKIHATRAAEIRAKQRALQSSGVKPDSSGPPQSDPAPSGTAPADRVE